MFETPQGSCTATRARELLYAIRIFDAGNQHSLNKQRMNCYGHR